MEKNPGAFRDVAAFELAHRIKLTHEYRQSTPVEFIKSPFLESTRIWHLCNTTLLTDRASDMYTLTYLSTYNIDKNTDLMIKHSLLNRLISPVWGRDHLSTVFTRPLTLAEYNRFHVWRPPEGHELEKLYTYSFYLSSITGTLLYPRVTDIYPLYIMCPDYYATFAKLVLEYPALSGTYAEKLTMQQLAVLDRSLWNLTFDFTYQQTNPSGVLNIMGLDDQEAQSQYLDTVIPKTITVDTNLKFLH